MGMLDTTLATTFIPGTNLWDDVAGANWSFLLPSLELERIVCFGVPATTTLATLSRLARRVTVIGANARQARALNRAGQRLGQANVHVLIGAGEDALREAEGGVDLVLIAGEGNVVRLRRDRALQAQIHRLLKSDGLIYFEFGGLLDWLLGGKTADGLTDGLGAPQLFWLTPIQGEMGNAVPVQDQATIRYFYRRRPYTPVFRLYPLDQVERRLSQRRFFSRFARRYGALAGRAAADLAHQPPRYLRTIAERAGIEIDHHRWGLAAGGRYLSRKVLFFLFDQASESPEYIVKMVRDPALNPRLENEYRALSRLWEKGIGQPETLPRVAFFGRHANLGIIGETMIEGQSFRRRTWANADCPYARAAMDWLIHLGAATADRAAASPRQVAEGLETLFRRFTELYRLAPEHNDFLVSRIAAIAHSRAPFPLVFQHGDPGTWNVLVTPGGRVAFLDWEAAEPQGMPLWDLFYFVRSYGVWVSRAAGTRDSLKSFAEQFLAESALSPRLIDATRRYCEQSGLSKDMVEPLFYTCWMHRALKEATRLPPDRLESGHYVNLLRLCIDRRDAPSLRRLFAPLAADGNA